MSSDITILGAAVLPNQTLKLTARQIRLIRNVCEQLRDGSLKCLDFTKQDAEAILRSMGAYIGCGNADKK